jgi:hypothetical protein
MNASRRGIIVYLEYQYLSLRRNWVPPRPHPLPRKRMWISQGPKWGETTRCGGGMGGDPIRTPEQKAWHSVYSVMPVLFCAEVFKCRLC